VLVRQPSRDILSQAGPIARHLGSDFEAREQQLAMASAVELALATKGRLLAEAGTGVGKSFAYLVPAMLRCAAKGERIVIATNTIALQEQLIKKDVPLLLSTLDEWGLDAASRRSVVPALVKGRGNYVSIRRLEMASKRQEKLFPDEASRRSLHVIEDWALETPDGTLSTIPRLERPGIWDRVQSDSDNCMGRKCPRYEECFYQQSRRLMEKANLLICNHAVFFADLAMRAFGVAEDSQGTGGGGAGFLGKYDHVILDEAHMIEDVACDHFGLGLTESRLEHFLNVLYSSQRDRGYLAQLQTGVKRLEPLDAAIHCVMEARDASRAFFEDLNRLSRSGKLKSGRVPAANAIANPLTTALTRLQGKLQLLKPEVKEEPDAFEVNAYAVRAGAIAFDAEVLVTQKRDGYVYWLEGGAAAEGAGGGTERRGGSGASASTARLKLACSPVEVGPLLKTHLWGQDIGVVLTSATLSTKGEPATTTGTAVRKAQGRRVVPVGDEGSEGGAGATAGLGAGAAVEDADAIVAGSAFYHVASRIGCERAKTLHLGSPFDHARQTEFYVDVSPRGSPTAAAPAAARGRSRRIADDAPMNPFDDDAPAKVAADLGQGGSGGPRALAVRDPRTESIVELTERILRHVRATNGGAFVLFTSHATMNAVAERLEPDLQRARLPMLVQGRDGHATSIIERFRQNENSVLLGAASFWQGVDVKGRGLRNVIITKLPFDPPDRPLVEARAERITKRGGNAFVEDSLPRAILRFKQGFGRLIRSTTDTGRIVVLDPRILTARYGKMFLAALPAGIEVRRV